MFPTGKHLYLHEATHGLMLRSPTEIWLPLPHYSLLIDSHLTAGDPAPQGAGTSCVSAHAVSSTFHLRGSTQPPGSSAQPCPFHTPPSAVPYTVSVTQLDSYHCWHPVLDLLTSSTTVKSAAYIKVDTLCCTVPWVLSNTQGHVSTTNYSIRESAVTALSMPWALSDQPNPPTTPRKYGHFITSHLAFSRTPHKWNDAEWVL